MKAVSSSTLVKCSIIVAKFNGKDLKRDLFSCMLFKRNVNIVMCKKILIQSKDPNR